MGRRLSDSHKNIRKDYKVKVKKHISLFSILLYPSFFTIGLCSFFLNLIFLKVFEAEIMRREMPIKTFLILKHCEQCLMVSSLELNSLTMELTRIRHQNLTNALIYSLKLTSIWMPSDSYDINVRSRAQVQGFDANVELLKAKNVSNGQLS